MIPHYTQAGLLGDMKILSHPASVDSIPTCGNQEDYVGMGYNASKKASQVAEKLQYVLAIELLSVYAAHGFTEKEWKPGTAPPSCTEGDCKNSTSIRKGYLSLPLYQCA